MLAALANRLNANVGDLVVFEFYQSNHTLTQSSLQSPCTPLQQFDSGFTRFNPSNRSGLLMSFTVNSPNSQWFFCPQIHPTSHCHAGMVFALNPGDQMEQFLANVKEKHSVLETSFPVMTATNFPASAGLVTEYCGTGFSTMTASNFLAPTGFITTAMAMPTGFYGSWASGSIGSTWRPTARRSEVSMPRAVPFTGNESQAVFPHLMLLVVFVFSMILVL
ncbi:hypothetical protein RJ035_002985 [Blastomyces gilchristii]